MSSQLLKSWTHQKPAGTNRFKSFSVDQGQTQGARAQKFPLIRTGCMFWRLRTAFAFRAMFSLPCMIGTTFSVIQNDDTNGHILSRKKLWTRFYTSERIQCPSSNYPTSWISDTDGYIQLLNMCLLLTFSPFRVLERWKPVSGFRSASAWSWFRHPGAMLWKTRRKWSQSHASSI